MGTLQSKIKDGYSIKQKSLFKKVCVKGVAPLRGLQPQISPQSSKRSDLKNNHLRSFKIKTALNSGESEEFSPYRDRRLPSEISRGYPASAIGLVQSRMNGLSKYSVGALISANIVITTAIGLQFNKKTANHSDVKFILDYQTNRVELDVEKIYVSTELRSQSGSLNQCYQKYAYLDYAFLVLKNHANVEKYGTLGFDFGKQDDKNVEFVLFGFSHRNYSFKLESMSLKANISQSTISFINTFRFDITGGPILAFSNDEYVIVGIQNGPAHNEEQERRCLKLNEKMFSNLCDWVTREQEEIDLRDKSLGKEGIKKLVNLKWTTLYTINISRNNLGTEGLKYFTKCEWPNLYHFDIGGNDIRKEGVAYLVKIPMKGLMNLNMWGNAIGSQGTAQLGEANWKCLININLYNNNISNQGIKKLTEANWRELENLNLGKNQLNANAIPYFQHAVWKGIISLTLWGNSIKNEKPILSQLNNYFLKMKFLYL